MIFNQKHYAIRQIAEHIKKIIELNNVRMDYLQYKSTIDNNATQEDVNNNPSLLIPYAFKERTIHFMDQYAEFMDLAFNVTELVERFLIKDLNEDDFILEIKKIIGEEE